jgi:hypothetical protein
MRKLQIVIEMLLNLRYSNIIRNYGYQLFLFIVACGVVGFIFHPLHLYYIIVTNIENYLEFIVKYNILF